MQPFNGQVLMVGEGFNENGEREQWPEIYFICVGRAPSMEGARELTLAMMAELFGGSVAPQPVDSDETPDHALHG